MWVHYIIQFLGGRSSQKKLKKRKDCLKGGTPMPTMNIKNRGILMKPITRQAIQQVKYVLNS